MIRPSKESSFAERLKEAQRFHMGTGDVHKTINALVSDLSNAGIDYVIIGGMALNAHGYRRETVDVDVLVRPEGLDKFRDQLVGRGYVVGFPGARKSFRNTRTDTAVEFITTGEYPGDGKPKPVAFPDPSGVCVVVDGVNVVNLPTLIELKLASGMTQPSRRRDLADVQDLIRTLDLERSFAESLDPFVQAMFSTLLGELDQADPHREEPAP